MNNLTNIVILMAVSLNLNGCISQSREENRMHLIDICQMQLHPDNYVGREVSIRGDLAVEFIYKKSCNASIYYEIIDDEVADSIFKNAVNEEYLQKKKKFFPPEARTYDVIVSGMFDHRSDGYVFYIKKVIYVKRVR